MQSRGVTCYTALDNQHMGPPCGGAEDHYMRDTQGYTRGATFHTLKGQNPQSFNRKTELETAGQRGLILSHSEGENMALPELAL